MKRFIFKTSFFVVPFSIMYFISLLFYTDSENPDLLRLGYIPNLNKNYYNKFLFDKNKESDKLSKHSKKKYKILTIGDSFSEQLFSYKNILAKDFSILHVDRFISKNQIQALINLTNGDFFDNINVEYVILQHVERYIIDNVQNIKLDKRLDCSEIDSLIQDFTRKQLVENTDVEKYKLFSKTTLKFPLYHFPRFFFQKNYLSNGEVFNVEMNSNSFFSNNSNKLIFYNYDLASTIVNNDKKNVNRLNRIFNLISRKLSKRNIKLIILPSPDKYDFYYDYIIENKNFRKPLFFDLMKNSKKEYIYIDSKEILKSYVKSKPDLYFYDDTHWSPVASKIIADEIIDVVNRIKH